MTQPSKADQRTCLVIGGRGFIGSAVVEEAQRRGYQVTVVEKDDYDHHVGKKAAILINANGNSKKFLAREQPSLDFDLSVRSVQRTLQDFACEQYVHLSTIDVYSDVRNPRNNSEEAMIDPSRLSPYGFHKYLAEQLVRYYAPRWLIFRMGGFVGRGLRKNPIYDLLKGQALRVHPDSRYQYMNTRDLAQILFEMIERVTTNEIFNVVGQGTISIREIASWIPHARLPEDDSALPLEHYEVNTDKIQRWVTLPDTVSTVKRFVEDVLANREQIA